MEWIWALVAVLVFAPAIIYQMGKSMKENREVRLEEMKQRSELDSKILGLDTSSSEIKVELASIRKEIAEIKQMIGGGAYATPVQTGTGTEKESEGTREQREISQNS